MGRVEILTGAERAAAILSPIETAKLNGVDREACLHDLPTRTADQGAR